MPGPRRPSTGSSIATPPRPMPQPARSIKSLIEDDVTRAFGHGIEAKRSKSGAITIRELA